MIYVLLDDGDLRFFGLLDGISLRKLKANKKVVVFGCVTKRRRRAILFLDMI